MGRIVKNTRYFDGDKVKLFDEDTQIIYVMLKDEYIPYYTDKDDRTFKRATYKIESCYWIDMKEPGKIYWPARSDGEKLERWKLWYRKNAEQHKENQRIKVLKNRCEKIVNK